MHKNNISHCDLKLENILITKSLDEVKLIDFGFAQVGDFNNNYRKGSEPYLSPELILQTCKDSFKNDIWSLGVILFALLTNRMPFDGAKMVSKQTDLQRRRTVLRRIAQAEFNFGPDSESLSSDAMDICSLMLTRNAENRPSAEQLLAHKWFGEILSNKICNG